MSDNEFFNYCQYCVHQDSLNNCDSCDDGKHWAGDKKIIADRITALESELTETKSEYKKSQKDLRYQGKRATELFNENADLRSELAETRLALELACTDVPTSINWWDCNTIPDPDYYLTQARAQLAKEGKDGDISTSDD